MKVSVKDQIELVGRDFRCLGYVSCFLISTSIVFRICILVYQLRLPCRKERGICLIFI